MELHHTTDESAGASNGSAYVSCRRWTTDESAGASNGSAYVSCRRWTTDQSAGASNGSGYVSCRRWIIKKDDSRTSKNGSESSVAENGRDSTRSYLHVMDVRHTHMEFQAKCQSRNNSDDSDEYLKVRQVINTERDEKNDGYLHPMPPASDKYLREDEITLQYNENGNFLDIHGYLKLYDVEPRGLMEENQPYDNNVNPLELKLSTMSSDTGYATVSSSDISDISTIQDGKEDFKLYENDGAELGVSERNADYADHDDIALNVNHPYDNPAELMRPKQPYMKKSRCQLSNKGISLMSAAVLVGCAIVLCMLLLCKLPGLKCIIPPTQVKPTPPGCIVLRGTACYFQYRIALKNTTEISLIKETLNNRLTLFNVTSLTNNSEETLFDQKNKMTFNVSVKDAYIEVSVYISETQCNHHGNYSILAISDENGFDESFVSVNVIAQCPCLVDLNIQSTGEITCSFPNAENTSILIQKLSSDMPKFLVNGSEIIRHIDLQATDGFSATWSKDGTLNIKLGLGPLDCSHEGNYNIRVTMNGTSTDYDVYLHVIDHPQTPEIAVASNGIIENTGGQISCRAMTGCNKAQFNFELSGSGNDIWEIWSETNEPVSTLTNLGQETQLLTNIRTDQVTYVDKKKFRCSYMFDREIYTSPALCIGIIPANFCQKDTRQCNYQHPYLCNKFISCPSQTWPLERSCSTETELHFLPDSSGCGGLCVWPFESNCSDKDNCS